MTAQTTSDVANLINGSDFALAVTQASTGLAVNGIFTDTGGDALDINGNRPRLLLAPADAALVALDSTLTVGATDYTVREKQPNHATTLLVLEAT